MSAKKLLNGRKHYKKQVNLQTSSETQLFAGFFIVDSALENRQIITATFIRIKECLFIVFDFYLKQKKKQQYKRDIL